MGNNFSVFFNQIFSKRYLQKTKFRLGKYTDRNKTIEQLQFWKNSAISFKEKKYFEALDYFFKYIKDPQKENVEFEFKDDYIYFKIYQGSKHITGKANNKEIHAHSDVVKYQDLDENILKLILKVNHSLKFCKFYIDENQKVIKLFLELKTPNLNPVSLYTSLREISITADYYDDFLTDNFSFLKPINNKNIEELSEEEKNVKLKYFKIWTKETLDIIEKFDAIKNASARSFVILSYIYKIYYLLSPEGWLLNELNKMLRLYYSSENKSDIERNASIIRNLEFFVSTDDKIILDSFYFALATFPVAAPVEPNVVVEFVKNEINKIHWYCQNKSIDNIPIKIAEYIIGYCLYYFGMYPFIIELFDIFWLTLQSDYFGELNYKNLIYEKKHFNYTLLSQILNKINNSNQNTFPHLNFSVKHLNLDDLTEFAISFIYEFINCDFSTE